MIHTASSSVSQDELGFNLYQNNPLVLERGGSFGGWDDVTEINTAISRLPSQKRELEDAPIQSPKSRLLHLDDLLLKNDDRGSNKNQFSEQQRESHSRKGSADRADNENRTDVPRVQQIRRVGSLESNIMSRSTNRTMSTIQRPGPYHRDVPASQDALAAATPSLPMQPRSLQLPTLARPPSGTPIDVAIGPPSQLGSISKEETLLPRRTANVAIPSVDRLVLDDDSDYGGGGAHEDASDTLSQSNLSSASTQHSTASSFRRQCRRSQQLLHGLMAASRPGTRGGGGGEAAEAPVTVKVPSAELSRASG
jgi:hypothetical protein